MIKEENLPEGWDLKPLSEVCNLNPRKSEVKELPDDENVTFLSMESVGEDGVIYSSEIKTLGEVFKGYTYFKKNDVLFAKITPCMENGKGAIANIDTEIGFGSTEFHVLRPRPEILPEWIYLFLASKSIRKLAEMKMTGSAGQKRVPKSFFDKTKIPVPPLKTQQKIVEILEKAEKLRKWRTEADVRTDEYLKSVFLEMFGDPLVNSKNWMTRNISDMCKTTSGGTPSRSKKEYYGGEIPWVKSGELNNGIIYDTEEKITELGMKNSSAKLLNPNTVLIAMYGATVGKTALLKIDATTNQAVCAIQPNKNYLNNIYLLNCLKLLSDYLVSQSIGGGQPNISQQIIKRTKIPIPPLELQNQFAETVKKVEQLKHHQKQSKQEIDNLFNTLMQKAFKGELTC